jgi:Tol biopolymer transport system component
MADGTILYSPDFQTTIHRISASGGESTSLTVIDPSKHTSHRWPSALPDGKHFLYSAVNHNPGLVEESTIFLASLDGSSSRAVLQNPYNAMVGGDKLLFVREETLLAATLDVGNGRITGDPVVVARNVAADLSTWRAAFSASATGVLAFHRANASVEAIAPGTFTPGSGGEATQAQWYDRNGQPLDDPIARVPQLGLRLSPDGERVAVSATTRGATDFDLWIYDAGEAAPARVTFMAGSEAAPVWSPDGAQLAFAQIFGASYADDGVFIKRIGGGVERRVVPAPEGLQAFPTDWSRDGKYIAYTIGKWIGGGGADIWALDVETGKSVALVAAPSNDGGGVFSPNGKWMAYQSNESGVMEVYVIPSGLPPSPTERSGEEKQIDPTQVQPASQRWQISVGGGSNPRWRDDGKELYYMSPDGMLMAVAADSEGDQIQLKSMTPLFQTDWELGKAYDVAPGGQRFIVNEVAIQDDTPISIVVNWQAGLGRDEGRLLR